MEDSAGCCKVQTPGCEACGPQDASSLDAKMTRYNLPVKVGRSSNVSGSTEERSPRGEGRVLEGTKHLFPKTQNCAGGAGGSDRKLEAFVESAASQPSILSCAIPLSLLFTSYPQL